MALAATNIQLKISGNHLLSLPHLTFFFINGLHRFTSESSTFAGRVCPRICVCFLSQQCHTVANLHVNSQALKTPGKFHMGVQPRMSSLVLTAIYMWDQAFSRGRRASATVMETSLCYILTKKTRTVIESLIFFPPNPIWLDTR